jgi:serine/threonine-protein kinase
MALSPGTRLGPYEILSSLGVGGMGEVYRAHDTALGRDVAIKILPDTFAHDPERLARFGREARTLAALNHPHIAHVYGFERSADVQALVMELVEGPTLADRIAQGAVPVDEALHIARQIAEALEAAHESEIIHRDLKPANVKVRDDGTVKVLDFGLAKALEPASGSPSASQSPTITTPAMTQAGVILGTAAYMAPEQAKGRPADTRSDVWSFGCVLYEMLTGKRAFDGEDVPETLAAVLRGDPDWSVPPADVPLAIRTLLRGCLVKDRRHRVADASTALFVIDHHADFVATRDAVIPPAMPATHVSIWRTAIPVAILIVVALVAAYAGWHFKPGAPRSVARFPIPLGAGDVLTGPLALSPDGTRLAYSANDRLYLRSFDRLDAVQVAGGDTPPLASPRTPFFSPDGQWLGYWESGQLKKVSVSGGAPVTLATVTPPPAGVTWGGDNTILFGRGSSGIWRVSGDGGTPERIIAVEAGERAHGPQLLPDGRTVLFTLARTASWDEAQIVVQSLDGATRKTVISGGTDARYLPTGHLVYALGNNVLAVPFDPTSGRVNGGPVSLIQGVVRFGGNISGNSAAFAVSPAATLVYAPTSSGTSMRRMLVWVDRNGREEAIPAPPRAYTYPRLSPDGSRLAVTFPDEKENMDIWILNLESQTWARLTSDPSRDTEPTWTPDGQRIIFTSTRTGEIGLFSQAANGTGTAERLSELNRQGSALPALSPDGRHILLRYAELGNSYIAILDLRPAEPGGPALSARVGTIKPLVKTEFEEYNAEIAPSGRWLAYQSNSSGVFEVNVRPFPDIAAGLWTVSTAGGAEPVWARDGGELFYRAPNGAVMRVSIAPESTWKASAPAPLFGGTSYAFSGSGDLRGALARTYDVSPDGKRFLMLKNGEAPVPTSTAPHIVVVQNWFEDLKRLVPVK